MKLVIVESPAKAQTIRGYLGDDYQVEASVGHIRDLPTPSELPKTMKNGPYSRFAVNVEDNFKPYYQVHADKKKRVTELRRALKEADELYLATDEDREGEAIAWHLYEVLKPKVPVKRMVFHEITKDAIQGALENTRDIDRDLVDAQETRRVLDRLFGYEVSPVLWRKVAPSLSAGRVQSVATRLVVDREQERMAHVSAEYYSLDATVAPMEAREERPFQVKVNALDGAPIAGSSDFGADGQLTSKAAATNTLILGKDAAESLVGAINGGSGRVAAVTQRPYRRRPAAPFTTSTLQQDASRKLKWNASTTMRVAQTLYEGGYITYMRTDSAGLSGQALKAARDVAVTRFGPGCIPDKPRIYAKKQKGAQEAHEAIRPSGDKFRSPEALASQISAQQLALYRLIYQRTVASQMNDAVGYTATVKVDIDLQPNSGEYKVATASTSGTVITDPGFQQLYRESKDKAATGSSKGSGRVEEQDLPQVSEGDAVSASDAKAEDHRTTPPGRYTEATLVKAMEDLGIGRPSTYAATIQTIGDRGYVTHRGQYLVPTWLAFSVTRLLVENLAELVDYQFTADMEAGLDHVAAGEVKGSQWLKEFYFGGGDAPEATGSVAEDVQPEGNDGPGTSEGGAAKVANPIATHGLKHTVENLGDIDAREVNSVPVAPGVVLRIGRYGPYIQHEDGRRTSVPPTVAPDEMTPKLANELLEVAASDGRELGVHPDTGNLIVVKNGRFGPYVTEVLPEEPAAEGAPAKKPTRSKTAPKPKTASLFKSMDIATVDLADAIKLMSLPREVGVDEESGEVITAQNGPYGPYLKKGRDTRQLPDEDSLLTVTMEQAKQLYAQPKTRRGAAVRTALREFGEDPVTGRPVVVKDGRFGPYVTDGQTNATVPRAETVEGLTAERAYTLLADRRDKAPAKKAPARKAPAKKAPARKTPAKKTGSTTTKK